MHKHCYGTNSRSGLRKTGLEDQQNTGASERGQQANQTLKWCVPLQFAYHTDQKPYLLQHKGIRYGLRLQQVSVMDGAHIRQLYQVLTAALVHVDVPSSLTHLHVVQDNCSITVSNNMDKKG